MPLVQIVFSVTGVLMQERFPGYFRECGLMDR